MPIRISRVHPTGTREMKTGSALPPRGESPGPAPMPPHRSRVAAVEELWLALGVEVGTRLAHVDTESPRRTGWGCDSPLRVPAHRFPGVRDLCSCCGGTQVFALRDEFTGAVEQQTRHERTRPCQTSILRKVPDANLERGGRVGSSYRCSPEARVCGAAGQAIPQDLPARGSKASRSPSPTRLKASTVRKMANPGKMAIQGASAR